MDTTTQLPSVTPANQKTFSLRKLFLISVMGSLILSALVAIFVFLIGNFGETEGRILATTLTIGVYSLAGLCSAVLLDKRKYTTFAIAGIIIAVIGFLLATGTIWNLMDWSVSWRWIIISLILSLSTAHASLLILANTENTLVNSFLYATIVCIGVVAGMLISLSMNGAIANGFFYRVLGVFAVLDVLGTIVVPILKRTVK